MAKTYLVLLLFSIAAGKGKYEKEFGADYTRAVSFISSNSRAFEAIGIKHKTNVLFVKAIVFPELIRYSYFSDFFETEALEWLYVEGGSKAADFSIGHFQVKPSFIERLEEYVSSEESLKQEYGFITVYDGGSPVRKQRINRMKELGWQLSYLSCFVDVATHKFSTQKFASDNDKLAFYASAYNTGFDKPAEIITKNISAKQFPYGAKYSEGNTCAYADVSLDYFLHYSQK